MNRPDPTVEFRATVHEWCGMVDDLDGQRCPCHIPPRGRTPAAAVRAGRRTPQIGRRRGSTHGPTVTVRR